MFRNAFFPRILASLLAVLAVPVLGSVDVGHHQRGLASYYHDALHGLTTASGEPYDKTALTAAHKRLPLGTRVRVTDLSTGRSVVVRINDRGPFIDGRIIDLSRRAAAALGMIRRGVVEVRVEVLAPAERERG